ncbi:MAG: PKD domain-containing protein [Thermoplasmatota archaeon]
MNKTRIVIISIICIFIVILGILLICLKSDKETMVNNNSIFISNKYPSVLERVYFSIDHKVGIENVSWDFGDNSEKGYGINVSHIYHESAEYNIICNIQYKEGTLILNDTVKVFNINVAWGRHKEGMLNLAPLLAERDGFGYSILEAVSYPTIDLYINFTNIIGTLDIEIEIVTNPSEQGNGKIVYSETITKRNEEYNFYHSFKTQSFNMPQNYIFNIYIILYNGRIGPYDSLIKINYR